GYYCGICKSIEKRYGQIPRLALNYDFVFLALVIGSLNADVEEVKLQRCPIHPLKKRIIVYEKNGIDYAADIMLLLTYFKLMDDRQDEKSIKAAAGAFILKNCIKKLMINHHDKCIMIEDKLKILYTLEKEKCPSLDQAAEPFAKLMEEVFSPEKFKESKDIDSNLRRIGYHIGKWIYLIDAFDDIEENIRNGSYNPLIYEFKYDASLETIEEFKERISERMELNLLLYLSELAKAWESLEIKKNKNLIDNIIYLGLLRKTEQILKKGKTEDEKSL
ncbi:MAG: hypothetical protein GX076_09415, partial [Clostridiales bacterium]|nr:hypothetical protein [Clostridiales bacterium]